ncbi:hypothetical protein PanWU01x14_110910, partial [Parasponia andersonii]
MVVSLELEVVDVETISHEAEVMAGWQCWMHQEKQWQTIPHDETFQASSSSNGGSKVDTAAYLATPEGVMDPSWYADSGATNHVTVDFENLTMKAEYEGTAHNIHFVTLPHTPSSEFSLASTSLSIPVKEIVPVQTSSSQSAKAPAVVAEPWIEAPTNTSQSCHPMVTTIKNGIYKPK